MTHAVRVTTAAPADPTTDATTVRAVDIWHPVTCDSSCGLPDTVRSLAGRGLADGWYEATWEPEDHVWCIVPEATVGGPDPETTAVRARGAAPPGYRLRPLDEAALLVTFPDADPTPQDAALLPTPRQLWYRLLTATPAERGRVLDRIVTDADTAHACFLHDHDGAVTRLQATVDALTRANGQLADASRALLRIAQMLRPQSAEDPTTAPDDAPTDQHPDTEPADPEYRQQPETVITRGHWDAATGWTLKDGTRG